MTKSDFITLIKNDFWLFTLTGFALAAFGFLFIVFHESNIKAETEFLIVQNNPSLQQDFYTLSRSAEYSARVLSEAIGSQLFMNEVLATDVASNVVMPGNKLEQLKVWKKTVRVEPRTDLGILRVDVLHKDRTAALGISQGITEVLTKKNHLFRGHGQDIDVRTLTGPIYEHNPTPAYLLLIFFGGFILGFSLMFLWKAYSRFEAMREILQPTMTPAK